MASSSAVLASPPRTTNDAVTSRLARLHTRIQKATQEAVQQATVVDIAENNDPNASFHLGMELFGQETSVMEENLQRRLSELEDELADVVQVILESKQETTSSPDSTSAFLPNLSPAQVQVEEQRLATKIEFLRHASQVRALLDQARTLATPVLNATKVDRVASAQTLLEAQAAWQTMQQLLVAQAPSLAAAALQAAEQVLQSLRRQLRHFKADLLDQAQRTWRACVPAPSEAHVLQVKGQAALAEAYEVLHVLDNDETQGRSLLQDLLRQFTQQLYDKILKEALEVRQDGNLARTSVTFHESEERSSRSSTVVLSSAHANQGSGKLLEWERTTDESSDLTPIVAWRDCLSFVQRILTFVSDEILLGRPALCALVGGRLLGPSQTLPADLRLESLERTCRIGKEDAGLLMEPLVEALVQTCLPTYLEPAQMHQLADTQAALEAMVTPFLDCLVTHKLLPQPDSRLSRFVSNFDQKYVADHRVLKLNQVRTLLMQNDYHNTVRVGKEQVHRKNDQDEALEVLDGMSVFQLHQTAISDTAQQVLSICRECLEEAVQQAALPHEAESPLSLLPATLYKTARECLDLYRAIIPVQYRMEIEQVPRTAAVLHNDCVFLAYHCQILGIEYKARFPSPIDVRGQILHHTFMFVDMVPSFRGLAENALRKMLDRQAQQIQELVCDRITLFGKALRSDEILAEWSEAEGAVNTGLYHIRHLSQAWKPVLSYEIFHRCICYLADVMFTLLLEQLGKASDISTTACQFVHNLFQRAMEGIMEHLDGDVSSSRVWERFATIGRCLDMTLLDIKMGLASGTFRSVTGQELGRLITATFDDTPKRRDLLKILNSHQT
jgi:centromere/kinetochore protein ZW10